MSAEMALQAAVVAALVEALGADVAGVFDGPPADAAFPHVTIEEGTTGDWSSKSWRGREHRLALAVRDDGDGAGRLHGLVARCVAAIEGLPAELAGHRIASLLLLRQRVLRPAGRPWAGLIEVRVRTVEIGGDGDGGGEG